MTITKDQLEELIAEGLSARAIGQRLNLSREGALYHLGKHQLMTIRQKTTDNSRNAKHVADWRRRTKEKLIAAHGGKCVDCNYIGPPYQYDFDHRDPSIKSFHLSFGGVTRAYDKLLEESIKCDLVCSRCHRNREHKRACSGCRFCE